MATCCALVVVLAAGIGIAATGGFGGDNGGDASVSAGASLSSPAAEEAAETTDADASQDPELPLAGGAVTSNDMTEGVTASDDGSANESSDANSRSSADDGTQKKKDSASKKNSSSGKKAAASSGSSSGDSSSDSGSSSSSVAEPASINVSLSVDSSRAASYGYPERLYAGELSLDAGSSAYDALVASGLAIGGSKTYVRSISGLAELACGSGSGWLYRVNGVFPKKACGSYELQEGDAVEFIYTVDLGNDV